MNNPERTEEHPINCPLCGSPGLSVFYEMVDVPANCNLLWRSKDEAINCPKGNIKLAFCLSCSFVTNIALDPSRNQYGDRYEDSLFYSGHFQDYFKKLVKNLVEKYNLKKKNILEIGSGKVDFKSLLVKLGNNHGLRCDALNSKIEDGNESLSNLNSQIDFVFSFCELEHMNYPKKFLNDLQKMFTYNPETHFFFLVPNALKDFKQGEFTNIIYEHASYFTVLSLSYLFSHCGFKVIETNETKNETFDLVYIDATLGVSAENLTLNLETKTDEIKNYIHSFSSKTKNLIKKNGEQIDKFLDEGKKMVLWGAGSRGVTILNILKERRIEYAVDINPNKQGMHIPGTGQKIIAPKYLLNCPPDFIILANKTYEGEITQILNEIGIKTKFIAF